MKIIVIGAVAGGTRRQLKPGEMMIQLKLLSMKRIRTFLIPVVGFLTLLAVKSRRSWN